jgi:translation initiation factor IF-2
MNTTKFQLPFRSKMAKRISRGAPSGRKQPRGTLITEEENLTNGPAGVTGQPMTIPPLVTVHHLADAMEIDPVELIKQLMRNGMMVSINQVIDYETAATAATDLGYVVLLQQPNTETKASPVKHEEDVSDLEPRPPVVAILGHVDHGKTSLLDAIRKTNIASREAGGITQHIGAYQAVYQGNLITFLDTPGHEAFTAMRARGAQATDIVILVIAADDGVMPQTIEAANHAKAAQVPIIAAVNKVDRPDADVERINRQLAEIDLVPEAWGGDTIVIPISAMQGTGIENLLENLLVLAEVQELKANPNRPAIGVVIEARLDKNSGPMTTVLVQQGKLTVGDSILAGDTCGRIKALISAEGHRVQEILPSMAAEILGLDEVPEAGDTFRVITDLQTARNMLAKKRREQYELRQSSRTLSLEDISARIQTGQIQELPLILKCDVQGSIDAVKSSLEKLSTPNIQVRIIHSAAGSITESDILLAVAAQAIIIGFNTRQEPGAKALSQQQKVDVRLYEIIYRLTEDVEKALEGMLKRESREVLDGRAVVRTSFSVGRRIRVAGCQVTEGVLIRNNSARVIRAGKVAATGTINSLKRFKDDAREVATGFECGIGIEGVTDFQEEDILECFHIETG